MTDRTISWYNEHADQLASRYDQADAGTLHALFRQWIPSGAAVLEIGCGPGRDAPFLASIGCTGTASDGSESMLETARQNLPKEAERNISFQPALFPLPEGHPLLSHTFDVITAIAVLMHIPDSVLFSFACQANALLKDQGVFFCSFSSGERKEKEERVFHEREPGDVRQIFGRAGFRLLSAEEMDDGLGRDILWTIMVFSAERKQTVRPVCGLDAIVPAERG